jgi:hypothetical protein
MSGSVLDRLRLPVAPFGSQKPDRTGPLNTTCQEARLTNPEAMNIYDINPGQAAITQSSLQINLLEGEDEHGAGKGETTWLALGLKLEEAQYVSNHCCICQS